MKFGIRTPSLKKSLSSRTTGKLTREFKKATNPLYGKKGMGWVNDPKKAAYNTVYNKTTVETSLFSWGIGSFGVNQSSEINVLPSEGNKAINILRYVLGLLFIAMAMLPIPGIVIFSIFIPICLVKNNLLEKKYARWILYYSVFGPAILGLINGSGIKVFILSILIIGGVYKNYEKKMNKATPEMDASPTEDKLSEEEFISDYYTELDLEEALETGKIFKFLYLEDGSGLYEPTEVIIEKIYKRNGQNYIKAEEIYSGEIRTYREDKML